MNTVFNATPKDIEIAEQASTVLHRMVKVLRKHTRNDAFLSLTERSTMGALYRHTELLPSELAQMEKVTTQSMSQVVSHLFELAFIYKKPSGDDKRKVLLSLTPAGHAYIEQSRLEKQEWLAHTMNERLSALEKQILMDALKILTKLTDDEVPRT